MSAKRPSPSCDVSSLAKKPRRRNDSRSASNYIFNDLQQLNTTESPLLRLPAELRNRIYEFVFGGCLIHVEHAELPRLDASLNEQKPLKTPNHMDMLNYWRMGDRFHIDPCKDRHRYCIPVPNGMYIPRERLWNRTPAHLNKILNLDVTRACRQIHDETKLLPFYLNIFAFRQATAFLGFFSSLRSFQGQGVKECTLRANPT